MGTETAGARGRDHGVVADEERKRFGDMLLIAAAGWLAYAINDGLVIRQWLNSTVDFAEALFALYVRYRFLRGSGARRLLLSTHLVALASLCGMVGNSLLLNRNTALGGWFLCMLPLFVAFIAGVDAAVVWAAISTLGALLLWLSDEIIRTPKVFVDPGSTVFFARVALVGIATGLGVASRRASDRRMAEAISSQQAAENARRLAEQANQAKSDFLANMSHELRTPLNAVLGFTGTLLMRLPGPLTTDQENQLNVIRGSAQHLLSLINDILDLAKIESGKMELRHEEVSCDGLLKDIATTLAPLAAKKGLQLQLELPAQSISLHTDQRALTQIVLNLGTNAIKFTEHGTVTMSLSRRSQPEQESIEFSVVDTGIGIQPEDQQRLFEAFSQIDHARDGTGLGLHLSQRFARLIGGTVGFESEYGKGSRFTLQLPVAGRRLSAA